MTIAGAIHEIDAKRAGNRKERMDGSCSFSFGSKDSLLFCALRMPLPAEPPRIKQPSETDETIVESGEYITGPNGLNNASMDRLRT